MHLYVCVYVHRHTHTHSHTLKEACTTQASTCYLYKLGRPDNCGYLAKQQ